MSNRRFRIYLNTLIVILAICYVAGDTCSSEKRICDNFSSKDIGLKYSQETNHYINIIQSSLEEYEPCIQQNCSCNADTVKENLLVFKNGITQKMLTDISSRGTKYQIIDHKLYRQNDCMFPSRCKGIEHFLFPILDDLPNIELIINVRDWPQVSKQYGVSGPIFSFSKTPDNLDILYPAWGFWEGGPAISLYPTGLGRWDKHRESIQTSAERYPWKNKKSIAFFRGSRTSSERDALVLLSRKKPELVDAQFTKNQAWKSPADTLNAEPAQEVSLEDHCKYKYLFNFRGVAASFRYKHLFLCKSLVFHVGNEWTEFFYSSMKPWVHYIPVQENSNVTDLENLINFFKEHDSVAQEIAVRGFNHIWNHLRITDVQCYWKILLEQYSKLLKFKVIRDKSLIQIRDIS